jgi:hypothetical protein
MEKKKKCSKPRDEESDVTAVGQNLGFCGVDSFPPLAGPAFLIKYMYRE